MSAKRYSLSSYTLKSSSVNMYKDITNVNTTMLSPMMKQLQICLGLYFFNFISNTPHHLKIFGLFRVYFDFFSDTPYMYHYCIFHMVGLLLPYSFIDLFRRKNPSWI